MNEKTQYNKKWREYLVKIMGISYDLSTKTKHDIFCNYSGHTNQIDIDIHLNGWRENKDLDVKKCIYLDTEHGGWQEKPEKELSEILKYLKSLLKG